MKSRLTISKKIQLCVTVMILLTVGLIVGTTFPQFEKTIADATKNHLMDQVTTEADAINNTVKEYYNVLKVLTQEEDVIARLSGDSTGLCEEMLNAVCETDPYMDRVVLLDKQGEIVISTVDEEVSYKTQDAVSSVLKEGKEYALSGILNAGSGSETVMLVLPIYGMDNDILGALAGNIQYHVFDEEIKRSEVTGIKNLAAYVMDKDGIILGHTEKNKVGTAVQNSVIQSVVERLKNGENIEKEGTSYKYNGKKKFAGYYVIPDSQWIVCLSVSESEIINPIRSVEFRTGVISMIQCILACVVIVILTSVIVKPIRITNGVLNQIAGYCYKIDENYSRYAENKDETGEMCASICTMVNSLRDEMTQINSVSEELTSTAYSLKKISESVTQSSENNKVLMNEMTESFDSIENSASDIGQYINEVRETANKMGSRANESMETAHSLMERASQIKIAATSANEESVNVFNRAKKTMETVIHKAESVEKIGMFTDAIMAISHKTKLLSLNASIEAANAGTYGKGFAVVADEIGDLAAQSAKSADSIGGLVNEIYESVNGMKDCLTQILSYIEVHVMSDYRKFSEASEEYSQDAESMIESMDFLKNEIVKFSHAMDKSVEEVEEINASITGSAERMHCMSEENASVADQIQETYEMIQGNSTLSGKLKKIVGKYNL